MPDTDSSIQVIAKTQRIIVNQNESAGIKVFVKTQRIIVEPNQAVLVESVPKVQRLVLIPTSSVSVVNAGQMGPKGPAGPQGIPGVPATFIELSAYTHIQETPAIEWIVTHNLGFLPAGVHIQDTSGTKIEGDVSYVSSTVIVFTFSAPFAGLCYLS